MKKRIPDVEAYICPFCNGTGGNHRQVCGCCEGTGQINKCECSNCCTKLDRGNDSLFMVDYGLEVCEPCAEVIHGKAWIQKPN